MLPKIKFALFLIRVRLYMLIKWAFKSAIPITLTIISIFVLFFTLWQLNRWHQDSMDISKISDRIHAQNEIFQTVAQLLGGIIVLTGLFFTWKNTFVSRETYITERFSQAIENLGDESNLPRRLGAIYALERIARESEKDHDPIFEILTTYLRDKIPRNDNTSTIEKCPEDIQAILTVIGRRSRIYMLGESRKLNLSEINIPLANLQNAHLEGVDLHKSNLQKADLRGAQLQGANLFRANLTECRLENSGLQGANLNRANLNGANLHYAQLNAAEVRGASLKKTALSRTDLRNASFDDSDLSEAAFTFANLDKAQLNRANLRGADFKSASLRKTVLKAAVLLSVRELSPDQLKHAIVDEKTEVPENLQKYISIKTNA